MSSEVDAMDFNLQTMKDLKVDTISWADPSLDLNDPRVLANFKQQTRRRFTHAKTDVSCSSVPCDRDSSFKPGGTITSTFGKWSSRCTSKTLIDPRGLGRWSGLTFQGKNGGHLSVITGYRSPRQTVKQTSTFYDQQYALLAAEGV
jgi:hypothetical protein